MNNRAETVVYDIVKAIRHVLDKQNVTFAEYRAAIGFLMEYSNAAEFEIPLTCDMWFNSTIADIEMKSRRGSLSNLEGPYFLESSPEIHDRIKTRPGEGEQLIIEGRVTDLNGHPVQGAELHVWHSDDRGNYSGYADDFPIDLYRGRKIIGESGKYRIQTTIPCPYMIPHDGPSGKMLKRMGRHAWRPAHVHFKVRADGFQELTTQAYFADSKWLDSDCVEGVRPALIHSVKTRDGIKFLDQDFILDPA